MKVYLTEAQLQLILIKEKLALIDENYLLCEGNLNPKEWWNAVPARMKNDLKAALVAGVSSVALIGAVKNMNNIPTTIKQQYINWIEKEKNILNNNTFDYQQEMQELHDIKVAELGRCMQDRMRRLRGPQKYDPNEIKMTPEAIITQCEKYDYDPVLVAAQAWNETAYGTSRRARETNSAFSVGCYDNGKNVAKYDTVDSSIEPYIQLMKDKYGVNSDVMTDIFNGKRNLVTTQGGYRYASDPNYEKSLKSTYNAIKSAYPKLSWTLQDYLDSKGVE